jgi:hypothetical protein
MANGVARKAVLGGTGIGRAVGPGVGDAAAGHHARTRLPIARERLRPGVASTGVLDAALVRIVPAGIRPARLPILAGPGAASPRLGRLAIHGPSVILPSSGAAYGSYKGDNPRLISADVIKYAGGYCSRDTPTLQDKTCALSRRPAPPRCVRKIGDFGRGDLTKPSIGRRLSGCGRGSGAGGGDAPLARVRRVQRRGA